MAAEPPRFTNKAAARVKTYRSSLIFDRFTVTLTLFAAF
jgi:hypothetical protein